MLLLKTHNPVDTSGESWRRIGVCTASDHHFLATAALRRLQEMNLCSQLMKSVVFVFNHPCWIIFITFPPTHFLCASWGSCPTLLLSVFKCPSSLSPGGAVQTPAVLGGRSPCQVWLRDRGPCHWRRGLGTPPGRRGSLCGLLWHVQGWDWLLGPVID